MKVDEAKAAELVARLQIDWDLPITTDEVRFVGKSRHAENPPSRPDLTPILTPSVQNWYDAQRAELSVRLIVL